MYENRQLSVIYRENNSNADESSSVISSQNVEAQSIVNKIDAFLSFQS